MESPIAPIPLISLGLTEWAVKGKYSFHIAKSNSEICNIWFNINTQFLSFKFENNVCPGFLIFLSGISL